MLDGCIEEVLATGARRGPALPEHRTLRVVGV